MTEVLQHPHELEQMQALFAARQPQNVLEIGVHQGGTLRYCIERAPKVTGVDNLMPCADELQALATTCDLALIKGMSQDAATIEAVAARGPFDWLFIDADHSYPAALADWTSYAPLVTGIVAFHDIIGCPGSQVDRLWAEIKAVPGQRTAEFRENADIWGGIGVVWLP